MPGQNAERAGFVPGLACAILSTERSQHRYFHRSGPTVGPCQPRTITGLQCFFGYHQAPGVLKQNSITTDVSADDPVILIFHRPVFPIGRRGGSSYERSAPTDAGERIGNYRYGPSWNKKSDSCASIFRPTPTASCR